MSKRLVTDQDEIYKLILEDPDMTEAVGRDEDGVFIMGANGSKRYITELTMEDDAPVTTWTCPCGNCEVDIKGEFTILQVRKKLAEEEA